MQRPTLTQNSFLLISRASLGFLCAIVVSGALVRLTGSGLGCVDWPGCSQTKFVDVSTGHSAIEQINRLFTGAVSAAVIAAVFGAFFVQPRRRSLIWLSSGLVIGVLAQVMLGAVVVLTGLNPWSNMAHFLVSMVLVTTAVVLVDTARPTKPNALNPPDSLTVTTRHAVQGVVALCGLAIVLGTLVTGTGPHAGDEHAIRMSFEMTAITRVHSATVLLCIGLTLYIFMRIKRAPAEWLQIGRPLEIFLVTAVAQGALGYLQYFSGVPAQLVSMHVALAVAVWISALRLGLSARVNAQVSS